MRSAELVGVAQPIARCGEVGGVSRRGEIAQRRMRTLVVVIFSPIRDAGSGVIEAEEQALVEKFVPHPAVEALAEAVLRRLTRGDVVPIDAVLGTPTPPAPHSDSTLVGSLPEIEGSRDVRLPPRLCKNADGQLAIFDCRISTDVLRSISF